MKRAVFKFLRRIYAFIEAIKETSFFSDAVCSVLELGFELQGRFPSLHKSDKFTRSIDFIQALRHHYR